MPRRLPPLLDLYDELLAAFGPQKWWPGESPLEVAVGAVLVQNTAWRNVEHAIANLKHYDLLDAKRLYCLEPSKLEELIKPAGYFRLKAQRLGNLLELIVEVHGGSLENLFALGIDEARRQLLGVNGVGPETADSILLYAGGLPKFVVDTYTRRVLVRHGWLKPPVNYDQMQQLFESRLPTEAQLLNEYHALIVRLGHEFCGTTPRCDCCPLRHQLPRNGPIDF